MPLPSRIRPLEKEDFPFVLSLSRKRIGDGFLDEKALEDYLKESYLDGLVLLVEDVPVSYLLYRLEGEEAEIDEIAIEKDWEGKGLAGKLLSNWLVKMAKEGKKTGLLEVREKNTRARKLYERLGFVSYRRRIRYYPDEDGICYRKDLSK